MSQAKAKTQEFTDSERILMDDTVEALGMQYNNGIVIAQNHTDEGAVTAVGSFRDPDSDVSMDHVSKVMCVSLLKTAFDMHPDEHIMATSGEIGSLMARVISEQYDVPAHAVAEAMLIGLTCDLSPELCSEVRLSLLRSLKQNHGGKSERADMILAMAEFLTNGTDETQH